MLTMNHVGAGMRERGGGSVKFVAPSIADISDTQRVVTSLD